MGSFWAQPQRIINTLLNPFSNKKPATYQKAVFDEKGESIFAGQGFEGGMISWVYCEFPVLASQATDDTVMALPSNFVMFAAQGSTTTAGTPADFRVQIYDVNGEIDFVPGKAVNAGNIGGNAGKVLILRHPHMFHGTDPQVEIRIANLANAQADIQFVLVGLQGVQV